MDGVSITVGTEFFDFESSGSITTVFAGGIAGNSGTTLVSICPALGTFYSNNEADTFFAGHSLIEQVSA
ncbi:hypothetical protein AsFPU3_1460 [Aphanothece sacrum FPU3]|nr:hypothetical protein AsFPU3_1460 [Aphanothece sacrum FPU3]